MYLSSHLFIASNWYPSLHPNRSIRRHWATTSLHTVIENYSYLNISFAYITILLIQKLWFYLLEIFLWSFQTAAIFLCKRLQGLTFCSIWSWYEDFLWYLWSFILNFENKYVHLSFPILLNSLCIDWLMCILLNNNGWDSQLVNHNFCRALW